MPARIRLIALLSCLLVGAVGCSVRPTGPVTFSAPPAAKPGSTLTEGMAGLVPATLMNANGEEVGAEVLAGKLVGLYFSAHWCPPCRGFTPSLVEFRDRHHEDFEIVFVSADRSQRAQYEYMKTYGMQWPAVPYGPQLEALHNRFGIQGIPTLVILSPDGQTVTATGRGDVQGDPAGALAKWTAAAGRK